MKVSTLILTYNEAANIARCLDALAWCDDVVVFVFWKHGSNRRAGEGSWGAGHFTPL